MNKRKLPNNFHPILFSTPMIQSILNGRKSQTRRITGLDEINSNIPGFFKYLGNSNELDLGIPVDVKHPDRTWFYWEPNCNNAETYLFQCPYGKIGDMLWVRESFRKFNITKTTCNFDYKADAKSPVKGWKPSIHMPFEACRIFLKIKDIRVERLQDISNEDALKEGIEVIDPNEAYKDYMGYPGSYANPRGSFFSLIEKIHGEEWFKKNPWVWVVEFEIRYTQNHPELINTDYHYPTTAEFLESEIKRSCDKLMSSIKH